MTVNNTIEQTSILIRVFVIHRYRLSITFYLDPHCFFFLAMLANERINDQRLWINPFSGTLLIHCNIVYIFVHCMLDDGCSSVRLVRFIPYKLFMNLSLYMGKILHSICMSKWALVLGVEELRTKICHSHMHNHKHKHTSTKTARSSRTHCRLLRLEFKYSLFSCRWNCILNTIMSGYNNNETYNFEAFTIRIK